MAELETLMLGYQAGDRDAATALIRQLSPLLLRFFLSQCESRPEAEDLVQDTWLRIHKARHTHRPGEALLPWIYAIARHVKVDAYRRSRRIRVREQSITGQEEIPGVRTSDQTGSDFDALIAVLPPGQREVVSMLKLSGMSLDEVARATASTVGAVKLKAHRAYEKLRAVLNVPVSVRSARSNDDVL